MGKRVLVLLPYGVLLRCTSGEGVDTCRHVLAVGGEVGVGWGRRAEREVIGLRWSGRNGQQLQLLGVPAVYRVQLDTRIRAAAGKVIRCVT